jgi:hypothetical protein
MFLNLKLLEKHHLVLVYFYKQSIDISHYPSIPVDLFDQVLTIEYDD